MTTTAKIKSKLPESHGLSIRLCDAIYQARAKGQPTEDLIIVGRISAVGHGEEKGKQYVSFEFGALEVATDEIDKANVRDVITSADDARHGGRQIPLDFAERNDEEQRRFLFGLIDEWQAELELTQGEVAEQWRSYFGIEPDVKDTPAGYAPADYRKADAHRLREFVLAKGIVSESDETGEGEETEATADPNACQVCAATGGRLTDGLCDKCAANAGVPVPDAADDAEGAAS